MAPQSGEPETWKPGKPYGYGAGDEAETEIARLRVQLEQSRAALAEAERERDEMVSWLKITENVLAERDAAIAALRELEPLAIAQDGAKGLKMRHIIRTALPST